MNHTTRPDGGIGNRIFRSALRTLPRGFRLVYGGEIYDFHLARMEEARGAPMRAFFFWLLDLADVLGSGVAERSRGWKRAFHQGREVSVGFHPAQGPGRGSDRERPGLGLRLETLLQDFTFALRSLRKSPGFALVSVLSLAVGVGLSASFYAFFQKTWLEPVPGVFAGDRVAELTVVDRGIEDESWSYPDFRDLGEAETPFAQVVGWKEREGTLYTSAGGEYLNMMSVSAGYFRLLGVVPALGRTFLPSEDVGPGQHPVAIISDAMWKDRLGADDGVIGETLVLNQVPYTVVGVAPPDFNGHRVLGQETEVWVPLTQDPWIAGADPMTDDRASRWLRVLGSLREGATLSECDAALSTLFARFAEDHPETNQARSARARSFGPVPAVGRTESLSATLLLGGLLGLVLLIICGNVTGMVLARSVTREDEIAIRLALGSSRGRLARLLLLEALILSVAGGVSGAFLGVWGLDTVYALLPGFPTLHFPLSWHLLPPSLGVIVGTALLVGVLPAIRFSRPELISSLREGTGGGSRRAGRIHRFAATSQTGLALSLLVVSGLFVRAVGALYQTDLGFEPAGLVTTSLDLPGVGIRTPEAAATFLEEIRQAVEAVPGVGRVTFADGHPVDLVGNFSSISRLDLPDDPSARVQVEFTRVEEGFFEAIGTHLLRGRGILSTDDPTSDPVVVISESVANRLWPGEDPVGRRVSSAFSRNGPTEFTVVGVVRDVAPSRPTEHWPSIFFSLRQAYHPRVLVLARASSDPRGLYRPVRETILGVEPALPYPEVGQAQDMVDLAASRQKVSGATAGGLGLLAILLAAIGIYGVVAFAVSRRNREIGLRMAMGAGRWAVLLGVLKDGVALAVPGLLVGGLLAAGSAMAFRSQLYGLSPVDPVAFIGSGAILLLVILLASFFPARRASGIDPMKALRQE